MQPFVSVIIPVYKVEKYLRRCLDSVCRQTLKEIEIILIDDGSPDQCGDICDEYADKDKRIRVIHKKNEGVSAARNTGIENASAEYISFIDSDDMIRDNMMEHLYNAIHQNDADISFCLYEEIDGESLHMSEVSVSPEMKLMDEKGAFDEFSDYRKLIEVTVWNKLFKKEIISKLRFDTNKKSAEDFEFLMRYLVKCKSAVMVNVPLYGYFVQRIGAAQSKKDNDIEFYVKQNENAHRIAQEIIFAKPEWINDMIGFATANSTISLSNAIVRMGLYRSREVRALKQFYRQNLRYILKSKLVTSKKIQVIVFLFNVRLYGALIGMKKEN